MTTPRLASSSSLQTVSIEIETTFHWSVFFTFIVIQIFSWNQLLIIGESNRKVYPGCNPGQHVEAVGLQQGEVLENLHGAQEREILCIR